MAEYERTAIPPEIAGRRATDEQCARTRHQPAPFAAAKSPAPASVCYMRHAFRRRYCYYYAYYYSPASLRDDESAIFSHIELLKLRVAAGYIVFLFRRLLICAMLERERAIFCMPWARRAKCLTIRYYFVWCSRHFILVAPAALFRHMLWRGQALAGKIFSVIMPCWWYVYIFGSYLLKMRARYRWCRRLIGFLFAHATMLQPPSAISFTSFRDFSRLLFFICHIIICAVVFFHYDIDILFIELNNSWLFHNIIIFSPLPLAFNKKCHYYVSNYAILYISCWLMARGARAL